MIKRVLMLLLATVAGYAVMVLLIFVAQDLMFGGIDYDESPFTHILFGGALTMGAAVVGGGVAALIFGKPWCPPALAMGCLVALETTYLISAGILEGPLWFDIMASGSLLVGIACGVCVVQRMKAGSIHPAPGTEANL